jgi:hypothetical protein
MEWLNLKTSTLHATEYIGSEPRSRAAWLNVILWCAQQENGGLIKSARGWKDRQWQQTCGVTRREVDSANLLLIWKGDSLEVWNYPVDKEMIVRERREIGKTGGLKSGQSRSAKLAANSNQNNEPKGQANASTEGKGIGIGIGMEGERKPEGPVPGVTLELQGDLPGLPPEKPAKSKPGRNLLMDALAGCGGADPLQVVASAWSGIGKALEEIRGVCPDVCPDEITRRAKNYRTHMRESVLTPNALAKNWALCDKPNQFTNSGQKPGGTSTYELEARAHGYTL